jgi:hypothetical protein
VKSVVSRLARLERLNRLSTAPQRLRIQYGYLKKLPDNYTGPRHVVTVRQLPPGPGAYSGEPWFEWEERHGPEPASTASRPNDDVVLQVCFVETTRLHGCNDNLSARAILESAHSPRNASEKGSAAGDGQPRTIIHFLQRQPPSAHSAPMS